VNQPVDAAPQRAVGRLTALAAIVSLVAGLALVFVYRPGSHGWLRTLHSGGAGVAVISAIAMVVVSRAGRLRTGTRGVVVVLAAIVVLGGAFATGSWMAWTGGVPSDRGIILSVGHSVVVSGHVVSRGGLICALVVHVALAACAAGLFGGGYVRSRWRRRLPGG
jgi:hypothetical protein